MEWLLDKEKEEGMGAILARQGLYYHAARHSSWSFWQRAAAVAHTLRVM
jgi:hypothetical protein